MHARDTMLCSEILNLHCRSKAGEDCELKAALEEIWPSGARFQIEIPIGRFTSLSFTGGGCTFRGHVRGQVFVKDFGYFIEMRFAPDCAWSEQKYRPQHLFNPLVLLADRIFEATLCLSGSVIGRAEPAGLEGKTARGHTFGN